MQNYWMKEALNCAQKAYDANEVPVGAVIVLDDNIIGRGWNQPISKKDPSAHAEIMALRDAAKTVQNYRLPEAILYVTLEPCMMCLGAMVHARIKQVVFATREPKSGVLVSNVRLHETHFLNHKLAIKEGIMQQESEQMLKCFFKGRRADKKSNR